jgi:hypothetical protein
MNIRALLLTLVALVPAAALAQSASFDLEVDGHPVGHDTINISKTKSGFKASSQYSFRIGSSSSDISNEFKLTSDYGFLEGSSVSNSVFHTMFQPNKARTQLSIGHSGNGNQQSNTVAIKPDLVVLPSFDAGAVQVLLLLATTHPTSSNIYSLFVPASGPSGGGGAAPTGGRAKTAQHVGGDAVDDTSILQTDISNDALWAKGRDVTGTLDGKPITVHAYMLAFGKHRWVILADDDNNLMQANVSMLNAAYIRSHFKLDSSIEQAIPQ